MFRGENMNINMNVNMNMNMMGEREVDKYLVEEASHYYYNNNHHHNVLNGFSADSTYSSPSSSSSSSTRGFGYGFSDGFVGQSSSSSHSSSSLNPSSHPHYSTPKTHFVDQLSDSSGYYNSSRMDTLDELGLSRDFQMMNFGKRSHLFDDNGHFGVNDCNVPRIRHSNEENFGFSDAFRRTGVSGSGGLSSPLHVGERSVRDFRGSADSKFGRVVNVGDGFQSIVDLGHAQSNVSYSGYAHQNYGMNLPVEGTGTVLQRDGYLGNGLKKFGGNTGYDNEMPMCRSNGGMGNRVGNGGGMILRGGEGYSSEIPVPMNSLYGSHVLGDSLQQCMMGGHSSVSNSWDGSQDLNLHNHSLSEANLLYQYKRQICASMGGLNTMDASQLIHSRQVLREGNLPCRSTREKVVPAGSHSCASMRKLRPLEQHGCDNTLILQEKGFKGGLSNGSHPNVRARKSVYGEMALDINRPESDRTRANGSRLTISNPDFLESLYKSLTEVQSNIYLLAKDQNGCRYLQNKFDEGLFSDVQLIFNGIIDHVVELMKNPFGNYLIQKLLDVCNEEQRMRIVQMVTRDKGELIKICLNTHGTRVVQKLIESLKTRKQISVVIKVLESGFLELIKDLNGNHVIQRCLQSLSCNDNKFIFDAAVKFCVEMGTHRHGCCVLQRCIAYSNGEHQKKLVEGICSHGLTLAQDPFGNYVIQFIIELKDPSASAQLISQFEGHYVHLATQKFSSHVVEKCLKFIEASQARIVCELLSVSRFEQLLQDPYANYVIRSALELTKGSLNEALVDVVRPYSILRTNPFCKKIFTRSIIKK